LYDPETGGYRNEPTAKPSLRATNAAVKTTKYLGGKLDDKEKTSKFVLSCYDDKTGAFAEPGGKPDVTITSIGVLAAMELSIAKEKVVLASKYISENAKTFEEIRIGAAAVEAWGGPLEWETHLDHWRTEILFLSFKRTKSDKPQDDVRELSSFAATCLRLAGSGSESESERKSYLRIVFDGQRDDGGWGKAGEKASDMESVYRVMRAIYMLKSKPKDPAKLREFIAKHRNDDGGFAVKPGEKSSAAGTYYAVIVLKWLDEPEKQ